MQIKEEIQKLANSTLLPNNEIAKIVGCSLRTVNRHAGSYIDRCKRKSGSENTDLFKIQKTVLLPDIHYPHCDENVMEAVNEFIFDYAPNELVYMGDQISLDCISSWNEKKPLLKEGQRLLKDYNNFDKNILRVHENLTAPDTRRIFMYGNHEQRSKWYCENHPELEGFIDIERHLKLVERGYKIVNFNDIHNIGKLKAIHGYYWNKYHAVKTLEAFEGNVVYAHVHNPQMFAKVSPVDKKGYHTATSLPCLCNINPAYKEGMPNFWVNGFGIVEHLPANGYFNLYTIFIVDGSFMWNGHYYGKNL